MDLEAGLQQSIGDLRAFRVDGKGQGIFQREVNKLVRVDGRWAVVVRLDGETVTRIRCDILCLYRAIRTNRVFTNSAGELRRIYGDDSRGGRGRHNRIKSGRGRYYDSGVSGIEDKVSAS